MSMTFGILLFAGFLLLVPVCFALFGGEEMPQLRSETVADAVRREQGIDCLAVAIGVDRRIALVEAAMGQFFLVFVFGRHLVVRKIRPNIVRMTNAASDRVISVHLGDFTARRCDVDLGSRSRALAWREKLRRHIAAG